MQLTHKSPQVIQIGSRLDEAWVKPNSRFKGLLRSLSRVHLPKYNTERIINLAVSRLQPEGFSKALRRFWQLL
eukprot:CAMPEP_0183380856 /NCGR_PEP_ID=MMETSP0164_2-20130417/126145_1 /TAXON_ID=221442 /ORGANISM="Coccolithus pelagicus ssp braarudi, Strain PLY182g" /LENGTH=72 /DNA_ID=CAMNT_0025558459 /DNA_START=224 /DNA_END=442 /DNA_ORIENTATION=+